MPGLFSVQHFSNCERRDCQMHVDLAKMTASLSAQVKEA